MQVGKITYFFTEPDFFKWRNYILNCIERINKPINNKPSRYNRFELHVRGEETDGDQNDQFGSSYNKIPKGNYYLKYYYDGVAKRAINLFHTKDGKFNASGRFPIFLMQTDIEEALTTGRCKLHTVGQIMRLALWDRLESIAHACRTDKKPARYELIESAAINVLKFREINTSNTVNHKIRISSRFVFCPKNVDGQGNMLNHGKWTFDANMNKHGSFTDVFDHTLPDPDKLVELFDQIGLILGIASESSGMKGVYVEATPEIYKAKLAYPAKEELDIFDNSYRYHSDILIQEREDGSKLSLFGDPQKMFAREKSLNHANLARLIGNDKQVVGDGFSFWRHYSYLSRSPELIGKIDDMSVHTTFNMVVAFVEGPYEPLLHLNPDMKDPTKFTPEEIQDSCNYFEHMDKDELSTYCDTADCHMKISGEIATQEAALERSMIFNNHESSFTTFFHEIRRGLESNRSYELSEEQLHIHLAYQAKCPVCENLMSPAVKTESMVESLPTFLGVAEIGQTDWACTSCNTFKHFEHTEHFKQTGTGRMFVDDDITPISVHSYYNDARSVVCKGIDLDVDEETGIALRMDLHTPAGMARVVSPEGAKAMTIETSPSILGSIDADLVDPSTGLTARIRGLKVDAIVPYGAFKGKNTGMSIAFTRFINAMLGTKYCPDSELDPVVGDIGALADKINEVYTSSKISYTRKAFNYKTKTFEDITVDNSTEGYPKVRIGIINLGITELNTEFFKVLTDKDPMKVSAMNSIAYNAMGLSELDETLRHCSKENFYNSKNSHRLEQLIRAYKSNPGPDFAVLKLDDLRRAPNLMFSRVVSKTDWVKFISQHQLFTDANLEHGVCLQFPLDTGELTQIVIPSRDILFSMVRANYGQRVLLNSAILKIIEIWKYLSDKNSQVTLDFIKKYRAAIQDQLRGKTGILAKGSTYVAEGVQGKEVASGFIPTNTVVVASNRFWSNVHRTSGYCYLEFPEFLRRVSLPSEDHDAIRIYGSSQRDPDIWFDQNLNIMEIWHPHRANRHTLHKFKISFFELYPALRDSKSNAIISNVLDVLYLFQSDSDGDLRRILCVLDPNLQSLMKSLQADMKGYKILFTDEYPAIHAIYNKVKWWHLSYLLKEAQGNTSHGFSKEYEFKVALITAAESNRAYINAIKAKHSIGLITVSQWIIQQIAAYLSNSGQITFDQYLGVCSFYQTVITQDGCIRSLKHVSGALNVLTIDEIAKNTKAIKDQGRDITPLDKVLSLIADSGYGPEIVQAFQQVVEFWMAHSMVLGGKMKPQMCTPYGLMIKGSCAFIYGSQAGLLESQDLYETFHFKDLKNMPIYKIHKDTIDFINSIEDKTLPLIKSAAVNKRNNDTDF